MIGGRDPVMTKSPRGRRSFGVGLGLRACGKSSKAETVLVLNIGFRTFRSGQLLTPQIQVVTLGELMTGKRLTGAHLWLSWG